MPTMTGTSGFTVHESCFHAYLAWLTRNIERVGKASYYTAHGVFMDLAAFKLPSDKLAYRSAKSISQKINEYHTFHPPVRGLKLTQVPPFGRLELTPVTPPLRAGEAPSGPGRPSLDGNLDRDDVWLWRIGERNINTVSQTVMNLAWMIGIGWRTEVASFPWAGRQIRFAITPKAQDFPIDLPPHKAEEVSWAMATAAASSLSEVLDIGTSIHSVRLHLSQKPPISLWEIVDKRD